ncbi:hypothetical protein G9A89_007252 [Geosiphon pyriformis]|nr:hypothetical protein G9A89_007252 [Geosiphon pyriformis]
MQYRAAKGRKYEFSTERKRKIIVRFKIKLPEKNLFQSFKGVEEYMSFSKIQANKEISKPIENEPSVIEIVYSMDWSATELGPMESWPDSIKSLVTFCLRSVCPHAIYLGTQHLLIYNQYCVPLLQNKHPHALGSPASEVWAETWDVVESIFTGVTLTGKGQYHEDLLLYISRAGYNEESYMSFAFSPIFAEDKTVIGIFAAVHETTERVISARRLKTLGELGKGTHGAKSVESSCHLVTKILRDHVADIPYALIYLVEENKQTDKKCQGYVARLAATTFDENLLAQTGKDGVEEVTFVTGLSKRILPDYLLNSPDSEEISTDKDNTFSPSLSSSSNLTTWPLEEVIKTNKHVVVELANESRAILLPVSTSFAGKGILTAILICGINSHRALDKEYLEFFKLVVGHFSSSLKNGLSREEERKKAKILADLNLQKIRFFQNISHELKTPLTLMLAPLEDAIATCEPDSSILFNLEMIQRNARRLLKLVNTLLEFSRIEAGHVKAYYCETKIAGLTRELVLNFQSMARSFGLTLIIDIPVDEVLESQLECEVYLDLDLYEKIIFNLCLNAFKHTWDGAVTIRLSPGKRESREVVFIEVSDTGVGIPKEELPNIFQRFYRVQSKQARSHEGTGIGLALVKELVNRHGGDIKVTSQVGVGSTFQIWIPTGTDHLPKKNIISGLSSWDNRSSKNIDLYLDESREWIKSKNDSNDFHTKFEDDENPTTLGHLQTLSIASPRLDSKKRSSLDKEKGSKDPKGRFKVLIVEDNADMRDYLINILKPEFEIFCACDGLHALRIINNVEFKPNLVLSDVMMPNMNGIELLKILRSDPSTQSIPFILLSARAGEEASLEGLRKGADDYLIKPFNSRELIARVRANINISNLYHEILDQQRGESETQQLLFSISNKIRSELSIQELLSTAVEQVFRILSCDSIFVLFNDPMNKGSAKIMAVSANDPDIKALVGTQVSCKAVDNSQDILGGQLDGLPEIDSTTHLLSSFLASFTEAPPDPSAPIKSKSDTENSFFDFEVKSHTNHFSRILNQAVSSMSVSIHLDSGSCGWIFAHRKPKETWSSSEKTFLQQISNQISLAITHSRLLEEKIKSEAQMEAAEAANKAKSQILANTSHELRTPLGAIIGILSAFEDTLFTADQKDMVQIMAHASDVVLAIVNDILDAAKLEAHKITLNNRTFDLFDLVEKTVEIFGESAGAKHIELVLLCERSNELPKYVKSDPER